MVRLSEVSTFFALERDHRRKPDFAAYEWGKRELQDLGLTPREYEQRLQELATRCGV